MKPVGANVLQIPLQAQTLFPKGCLGGKKGRGHSSAAVSHRRGGGVEKEEHHAGILNKMPLSLLGEGFMQKEIPTWPQREGTALLEGWGATLAPLLPPSPLCPQGLPWGGQDRGGCSAGAWSWMGPGDAPH